MPKKVLNPEYIEVVGRRKEAVARVRMYFTSGNKTISIQGNKLKAGEILINKKPFQQIFVSDADQIRFHKPLELTNNKERFAISIIVRGGGKKGQLEAMVHGLSRAIEKVDKEAYRTILKKEGMLTRDSRTRERRKVGRGGKARRQKQSPKR